MKCAIFIEDLYRCFLSSFGSFGQAVSEEKIKTNRPIKNKNSMRRPFLLTDQDQMCNLYRGPAIDAFNQVSVHFAKRFQRRRFLKIGQSETRIACGGHFVNVSEPNVQSLERTFYRCFLPTFSLFGWVFSDEKIKMCKVNRRRTPIDGKSSHCLDTGHNSSSYS